MLMQHTVSHEKEIVKMMRGEKGYFPRKTAKAFCAANDAIIEQYMRENPSYQPYLGSLCAFRNSFAEWCREQLAEQHKQDPPRGGSKPDGYRYLKDVKYKFLKITNNTRNTFRRSHDEGKLRIWYESDEENAKCAYCVEDIRKHKKERTMGIVSVKRIKT